MTTVSAVMRRSYSSGMFDDLNVPAHVRTYSPATDVTTLTFNAALTGGQVAAVFARMESCHDADQSARADLRTKRAAVLSGPTLANVAALAVATANYELGEST